MATIAAVLPEGSDDREPDLRRYVLLLRRRFGWIVLPMVVTVGVSLLLSLRATPVYEASSEILINQRSTESLFSDQLSRLTDPERALNDEIALLESGVVRDAVDTVYDGPLAVDLVSARPSSSSSNAVTVQALGADPDEVARLVNTYVDAFIEYRRSQRIDDLLAAGGVIQTQIDGLEAEIAAAEAPLTDLDTRIAQETDEDELTSLVAQRGALAADVEVTTEPLRGQLELFSNQLDELQLSARIAESGGAQVLTPASVPTDPASPKPVSSAVVAAILGLLIGVGVAFARDALDDSIRSVDDLERLVHGSLPILGAIPDEDDPGGIITELEPTSAAAEAYRSLRTAVRFSALEKRMKVIQVTSPSLGEGKTTTAVNLAIALGQAGQKVVVVCCDLRRPQVHRRFGLDLEPGFTDVLLGESSLSRALRSHSPKVYVLPAGSRRPNPSELVGSTRAEAVIAALAEEFDFVLLDSTPILPVTDGLVVSHHADATLLVASAQDTNTRHLQRALSLLGQADAPLIGFVLTKLPVNGRGGYGYSYRYEYAERDTEPRRGARRRAADRRTDLAADDDEPVAEAERVTG